MLYVKTYLDKDAHGGIGLFAGEDIAKGSLVWNFHPFTEKIFSPKEYQELPEQLKKFVRKYSYQDGDFMLLNIDDSRFFNHSDNPNVVNSPDDIEVMVAERDIAKGEELTSDYMTDGGSNMGLCTSFLK